MLAFHQTQLSDPGAVIRSIDEAALRQKSVHWTNTGWDSGQTGASRRWRSTSDVTAGSGVQRITISLGPTSSVLYGPSGKYGPPGENGPTRAPVHAVTAEIRLADDVVYVKGNVRALKSMTLGLTRAQALRYAGRWISMPKWRNPLGRTWADQQNPFLGLPEEVTLADLVGYDWWKDDPDYLSLTGVKNPWEGTQVVNAGDESGSDEYYWSATLQARTGAVPLPITFKEENGGQDGPQWGGYSSGQYSGWNEPVHVIAPKRAVPLATVRAS